MKVRRFLVTLLVFSMVVFLPNLVSAVSFNSSGGGSPNVTRPTQSPSAPSHGMKQDVPALLDLTGPEKGRLAQSIELTRLTSLQAKVALEKLSELDDKNVTGEEIKAHLIYAQESLEIMEKAGKHLDDSVKLVKMAIEGRYGPEKRLAAIQELFQAVPALAEEYNGVPSAEDVINNEFNKVGRGMKRSFDKAMNTLSNGAKVVTGFASTVGKTIKNGVSRAAGLVGSVHTKIGLVMGQKNWTNTMTAVTCITALVGSGVGLIATVSTLPATATGAVLAVGAVAIYTAVNVGALCSLANNLNIVSEKNSKGTSNLGNIATRISQGTALIGLAYPGGGSGEIVVGMLGLTGDEIAGSTHALKMTPEEIGSFLDDPSRKQWMENNNSRSEYKKPSKYPGGGGENEGGGSSGGGCSGGH